MDEETAVSIRLSRIYAKLLGELSRLDSPPKRILRLKADRQAYEADAGNRDLRRKAIVDALPAIAQTIQFLNPAWLSEEVKPIRPNQGWRVAPPGIGWIGAALDVVRDAGKPLTVAEICSVVADRFDYDMSTVELRQRMHTAVRNSLIRTRFDLIRYPGKPERWSVRLGDDLQIDGVD